jgi:hypothetical protein
MDKSEDAIFHDLKPIRSDFKRLKRIYEHRDDETTVVSASVTSESVIAPSSLPAKPFGRDTTETMTIQTLDDGREVITFITWAKD